MVETEGMKFRLRTGWRITETVGHIHIDPNETYNLGVYQALQVQIYWQLLPLRSIFKILLPQPNKPPQHRRHHQDRMCKHPLHPSSDRPQRLRHPQQHGIIIQPMKHNKQTPQRPNIPPNPSIRIPIQNNPQQISKKDLFLPIIRIRPLLNNQIDIPSIISPWFAYAVCTPVFMCCVPRDSDNAILRGEPCCGITKSDERNALNYLQVFGVGFVPVEPGGYFGAGGKCYEDRF